MRDAKDSGRLGRRDFVAGAAGMGFAALAPKIVRGTAANETIELGMIGCGGRGTWIAPLFEKNGPFRFVACADYFPERANAFGDRFGVPAGRRHATLSGYRRLLEGKLDGVVIETPPYFHPEQAAAAVEADKHVFLAKPIAVDVPGCATIAEAGRKATEKGLAFLVDFQTRNNELYREAVRRVRAGAIGRRVCGDARYPWSGGKPGEPKTAEERLASWYTTRALSGDFIVEQSIHTLDVATWFIDADPISAYGRGATKGLRGHGDIWDHFAAIYAFPDEFYLCFSCVQVIPGCPDAIPCRIYGSKGLVDTDYFSHVWIRGENPYEGGALRDLYTTGAVNNIRDFARAIAERRAENETVAPSVRSNLTAILGRTAGYRGGLVTWKEMLEANERLEPDLRGLKA